MAGELVQYEYAVLEAKDEFKREIKHPQELCRVGRFLFGDWGGAFVCGAEVIYTYLKRRPGECPKSPAVLLTTFEL